MNKFKYIIILSIIVNLLFFYMNEIKISENSELILYSRSKFISTSTNNEIKILFYQNYIINCRKNENDNKISLNDFFKGINYEQSKNSFILVNQNCIYGYKGIYQKQIILDFLRILSSLLLVILLFII